MSGFSADWLALRELADCRARDLQLMARLVEHLSSNKSVRVIDMGCGTGSNLRVLAPWFGKHQHWYLVDHDDALLAEADRQTATWLRQQEGLELSHELLRADLLTDLSSLMAHDYDLVTAAALFDLVSRDWIDRFVAELAGKRCAFYTVLTYDGNMRWFPPHPADAAIEAAFNTHQRQDKGLGPAAGPDAAPYLAERLEAAGFSVSLAPSPWRLTQDELPLILANADGVANAADEIGNVPKADLAEWRASRHALTGCEIGHLDLLALP